MKPALDHDYYPRVGISTVACELCGAQTPSTGTKRCDRCWELETRILNDLELAREILRRIEGEESK
jgi:hypothetical protein